MTDILQSSGAFPVTNLYTGRVFWRSDLGLWCYYDGAQWLTEPIPFPWFEKTLTTTQSFQIRLPVTLGSTAYSVYLDNHIDLSTFVSSTNDGSNKWTGTIAITDSLFANAETIHTFDTGAAPDTASTWTNHDDAPDVAAPSVGEGITISVIKTGSPGALTLSFAFMYQLIIPTS